MLLGTGVQVSGQDYKQYPMWDPAIAFEKRVDDAVSRMTLEEKVGQMMHTAPAIPRLGIPAYNWWNEVLHGVARTPFHTTSYPQAIGMAATWDTTSLRMMANYSAIEGRAVYNKGIREGLEGQRYLGLTYWTPNINIFRDPRWGRGQETYGEDPFLTGNLGAAFVRGLQGDDPKYLLAAACAKHFAVHSGPEPTRHSDNFDPSAFDLWDTYLPAFKKLVTEAHVAGVMCAYNAVYSKPCCANDLLMMDILRRQWNFTGYVTTDCWALNDFFQFHKTHPDKISTAVDAVMHGNDVECGQDVLLTLAQAVKEGRVPEAAIDASVKRLFTIRYRLGLFDPPASVPFGTVGDEMLEAKKHGDHALKMARQSIVLLKNDNNTLPLSKQIRRIVLLGPNADNKISVLGNYNGIPTRVVSLLDGLKEKLGAGVDVIYEQAINFTNDTLMVFEDYATLFSKGVKAEFFGNTALKGNPVLTTTLKEIDYFRTEGQAPVEGIGPNYFSTRYTAIIEAPETRTIHFEIAGDDGYRLFVNGELKIDSWERNRWGAKPFDLHVQKGQSYKIVVEHFQNEGNSSIYLRAGNYVKTDFAQLIQRTGNADAYIFAGGISPQLEGEEMPVNYPGFNGGDRTSIMLPAVQTSLMKALKETGKPVIFVMMTGSAIATPWESENIPAMLNTWYGGQSAGTAIVDVLFGDYNPGGRLPVTFYKTDTDLPDFSDYDMKGRTYRYFDGEALYPFGYGLSYTHFKYHHPSVKNEITRGQPLAVQVRVENTGSKDGDEVVQLYVQHEGKTHAQPIRALKGFQRLFIPAGQSQLVSFNLLPEDMGLVDENGNSYQPAGKFTISIGGGQPGVGNKTTSGIPVSAQILVR